MRAFVRTLTLLGCMAASSAVYADTQAQIPHLVLDAVSDEPIEVIVCKTQSQTKEVLKAIMRDDLDQVLDKLKDQCHTDVSKVRVRDTRGYIFGTDPGTHRFDMYWAIDLDLYNDDGTKRSGSHHGVVRAIILPKPKKKETPGFRV